MKKFIIAILLSSLSLTAQQTPYVVDAADKACETDADCVSIGADCCGTGEQMDVVSRSKLSMVKNKHDQFCRKLKNDDYDKQMSEYKASKDAALAACKVPNTCLLPTLNIKDLCVGKTATSAYHLPSAPTTCANKVCTLKTAAPAAGSFAVSDADKTCEKDYDCDIISLDCCLTGAQAVAVSKLRKWTIANEHRKYCQDQTHANDAQRRTIVDKLQAVQNRVGANQDQLKAIQDELRAFKGLCADKYQSTNTLNLTAICTDKVCKIK